MPRARSDRRGLKGPVVSNDLEDVPFCFSDGCIACLCRHGRRLCVRGGVNQVRGGLRSVVWADRQGIFRDLSE